MRSRQATRPDRGGGYVMTGAKDAEGIPVELTGFDIERMDRPAIDEYRERRERLIEERKAKAREADDLDRYRERFEAAGGDPSDARASWLAQKKADATEAANRAEVEALEASRRRVRGVL